MRMQGYPQREGSTPEENQHGRERSKLPGGGGPSCRECSGVQSGSTMLRFMVFVIPSLQSPAAHGGLEGWGAFTDEKTEEVISECRESGEELVFAACELQGRE